MASDQELHQRVAALSRHQREALAQLLRQCGADLPMLSGSSSQPLQRLVAYVVPRKESNVNASTLRESLKAKLPNYMVPAAIVPLTTLPRTANGKIDAKALPVPPTIHKRSAAPRTRVEATLIQIWQAVLRLEAVGIHDNFFELGGDSILSIQIVSQAREAGLRLAPNQLFEQPTIAELAAVVNLTPAISASQQPVTGLVPLTPIQHWFFEQNMTSLHHWHQAMLIGLPAQVDAAAVEGAIAALWTHHDALRLHFNQDSTGWRQINLDAGDPPELMQQDLSHLSQAEQIQAVADQGSQLHSSLTLSAGGLMRAAYFTRGDDQPAWLLLSLHHLVVDAVSWQILISDLAKLLDSPNPPGKLPAKTTDFKTWAETLVAQAIARQSEAALWFAQVEAAAISLPQDYPNTPTPTEATAQTIASALDAANTQALLQSVPAVYNTQTQEVLLTALAQTLLGWSEARFGGVQVEVEAHGREQIASDMDVSRTVGWFTTTYPVTLQLSNLTDCAESLKSTKEQLRQIPDRGIGYGLLRYLGDLPTRDRLAQASPSEVLFNYLGQHNPIPSDTGLRVIQGIDVGVLRDPRNRRPYRLELNAWIADTQLQLNWRYDRQVYRSETLASLADQYLSALKALIAHCATTDSGGFTPSDFPDADFSQSELDDFIGQLTQEA